MHGISFGSIHQPYRFGFMHGFSGNNGVARGHHDRGNDKVLSGNILSNLHSSIDSLRSQLESLSTSRDLPVDWSGTVSASAMGAQIINKQRGELQIHTQDGDVVTLKFSSKVGVRIEGEQISDGSSTLSNTSLEMHSRSKTRMSVEGDLSDAELAAINNLVGKVDDLTSEFFNGDMESVLAQAMSLSYDTSVLADYSLDLSLKQSVRAYTYAVAWVPLQPADPVPEQPAAAPAPTEVAAEATPTEPATTSATPPADSTGSPTQRMADFVAKVRSSFRMTATDTSLGMSYELKVKLLISSIADSAPAEQAPDSAQLEYLQNQLETSADA